MRKALSSLFIVLSMAVGMVVLSACSNHEDDERDAAKERIFSLLPEDQKEELIALFDEFEAYETAEAKFAHSLDNLQPLLLNNSNDGGDWREHRVTADAV